MTRFFRASIVFIALQCASGFVDAASLKVAPGRFIVHNVKPGKTYDIYKETGLRLTIYNDDEATRTWVLSTHRPSERGRWETGYVEIPDPRWCWFEKSEITVGAKSKAYANLYLMIPNEEKYYNQHWVVTLGIGGKPGRGGISLAVDIRAQIETRSKADLKGKPDGLLGLKPSTIRFENVTPGTSGKSQVVLYNNDTKAHRYSVTPLFQNSKIEPKVYLTQSYGPIPDTRWIKRKQAIQVGAGKSVVLPMELEIPRGAANSGKKWEEILLIQPDEGLPGFVRVQVQTKGERKAD